MNSNNYDSKLLRERDIANGPSRSTFNCKRNILMHQESWFGKKSYQRKK